ncbi:MAG: class I SAM-dependent methyltransferase [Armatimonadota bacterium]
MIAEYESAYSTRTDVFGTIPHRLLHDFITTSSITGRALDIGAGDGRNSIFLAENGLQVDALDVCTPAIERLQQVTTTRGLDITPRVCAVQDISPDLGPYDLVVADTVLCHVTREEAQSLADTIARLLKPDGWLYAVAFASSDPRQSEFAPVTRTYFTKKGFCHLFHTLRITHCDQKRVFDTSHGADHEHEIIQLIATREGTSDGC